MGPGNFELRDATPLAHALAASIARDRNIRLLSIKGPVAEHHLLRGPRTSADADVLVEPEHFSEFCEELERRGWHTRTGRETPSLLPQHSITYIHPEWPCDFDVHWMFPGFFADPLVVFDVLWATRVDVAVAHIPVTAPSKAGSAVVMALHAARDPRMERHAEEHRLVMSALCSTFTESERREFVEITRAGSAGWALRDLFADAGLEPVDDDVDDRSRQLWDSFVGNVDDASSLAWWSEVRAARWWQKPSWIVRAVWVSRRDVPRNDPGTLPSHREFWAYQLRRWVRGWRASMRFFDTSR